jgi:hypothetical protein
MCLYVCMYTCVCTKLMRTTDHTNCGGERKVVEVLDGDTVVIDGEEVLRELLGHSTKTRRGRETES